MAQLPLTASGPTTITSSGRDGLLRSVEGGDGRRLERRRRGGQQGEGLTTVVVVERTAVGTPLHEDAVGIHRVDRHAEAVVDLHVVVTLAEPALAVLVEGGEL